MQITRVMRWASVAIVAGTIFWGCSKSDNNGGIQISSPATNADENIQIVGGGLATRARWPWIAALDIEDEDGLYGCGGTLIAPTWVLTAAHCVEMDPVAVRVLLGTNYLKAPAEKRELISAKRIIMHPQYNQGAHANHDLALIELSEASSQTPIASWDAEVPEAGTWVSIAGWGSVTQYSPFDENPPKALFPDWLHEVSVPVVSNETCQAVYGPYGATITKYMFCAGFQQGGKDACQGDSGGPVVRHGQLMGVVSWGGGCAWEGFYTVYTGTAPHRAWIGSYVN